MGIITHPGLLGTVSGKVGNVVIVKWKDKTIVRESPGERRKPVRESEIRNWSNFSIMHHWLKPIIHFLRAGFNNYPGTHAFNAAKSLALKNAFEGKPKVFNPALVQVSWGDLPLPGNIAVEKGEEKELVFTWDTINETGNGRDQAMLLAYDPAERNCEYELTGQFRSSGSDKLVVDQKGNYHVYIAFVAADRSRQSVSQYLGSVHID